MQIDWAFRPQGIDQLVERAPVAVRAAVRSISPGRSIRGDSSDAPPIPTQRVTFVVSDRWYGPIATRFTLFKTGSATRWVEEDPPYRVGESYALFLERRGDGAYLPVAPDGRVPIRNGTAAPLIPGPVADTLARRPVAAVEDMARRAKEAN